MDPCVPLVNLNRQSLELGNTVSEGPNMRLKSCALFLLLAGFEARAGQVEDLQRLLSVQEAQILDLRVKLSEVQNKQTGTSTTVSDLQKKQLDTGSALANLKVKIGNCRTVPQGKCSVDVNDSVSCGDNEILVGIQVGSVCRDRNWHDLKCCALSLGQ